MCLLMHKPATVTISRELADDIFTRNSDGFGVLYAQDGMLYNVKTLGGVDDIWEIINDNQHRELLLHWRMRTHGDVDLTNCHPYEVYGDGSDMPVYMMHNGVLSTGNSKDTTKSDTWHYIRDWIIPVSQHDPSVLFTSQMRALIANHIGSSNKFAMMNHLGEVSICNRASGVEHAGLWFSNTYAWSASKFGAVKYQYNNSYNSTYYGNRSWEGYDRDGWLLDKEPTKAPAKAPTKPVQTQQPKRKPGRPRKNPQPSLLPSSTPAPTRLSLHQRLVEDLRDLLGFAGLQSVNKAVTDANLTILLNTIGYSDVADLINMVEFGELTEDMLISCIKSSDTAWQVLYGNTMTRTADQFRNAMRDNIARAKQSGMTDAEISQWAAFN